MTVRKIVVAAGTGFLGQAIVNHYKNDGVEIVILTRAKSKTANNVRYVNWDAETLSGWEHELENVDILINLTGKSVDCRYTPANKKAIFDSRVNSTKVLNEAVLRCKNPPRHWLNASTATIYRHSPDKQMDEYEGEIGDDFSMNVAKSWEKAFFETETPKTLKTALRTSIVLGQKGGALVPIANLAKFGLGGKQGPGNQFISWIHETDFVMATAFIASKKLIGVVNVVSPAPVKNTEFMSTLRNVLNIPFGLPLGRKLLSFGARIIGTETELVLKSRNVIPKRLQENGFDFKFATLEGTLKNLCK